MNFGPETSEDDSHAIMDRAHELGVNFFDTANGYGRLGGQGCTEEIIGRWFAKGGGSTREDVLATKVYGEMTDWPNGGKLSALNIRQSLDASLVGCRPTTSTCTSSPRRPGDPWDEIWQGDRRRRAAGQGALVGSSNFAGWHIAQAQEAAVRRGSLGLVSEQSFYNLVVARRRARGPARRP